jgi:hypothetical protein
MREMQILKLEPKSGKRDDGNDREQILVTTITLQGSKLSRFWVFQKKGLEGSLGKGRRKDHKNSKDFAPASVAQRQESNRGSQVQALHFRLQCL